MTVKELREKLQSYPDDKEVVMWGEKGYSNPYESNCVCGLFPVVLVEEIKFAFDKKQIGKIKLSIDY